jgi:hypothetical protein
MKCFPFPRSLLLLTVFSLTVAITGATNAQQRQYRDWVAGCDSASGYCAATTYIGENAGPNSFEFRLRVARSRPGAELSVAFSAPSQPVNENEPIGVKIDDGEVIALEPNSDYMILGEERNYFVARRDHVTSILSQMRDGERLTLSYLDKAASIRSKEFSLLGLSTALGSFDGAPVAAVAAAPTAPQVKTPVETRNAAWRNATLSPTPMRRRRAQLTPNQKWPPR